MMKKCIICDKAFDDTGNVSLFCEKCRGSNTDIRMVVSSKEKEIKKPLGQSENFD